MKVNINVLVIALFGLSYFVLSSCRQQPRLLEEGNWRGIFHTHGTSIPFNFIVEDDTAGTVKVFLTNAEEKTVLDGVRYDRDSVIIDIEVYDAILIGKLSEDGLSGYFRKNMVWTRQKCLPPAVQNIIL